MKNISLLIALFSIALIHNAVADNSYRSGNKLLGECSQGYSLAACLGYIMGIADVLSRNNPVNGFNACIPDRVQVSQLRDIVVRFLIAHPADRQRGASGLVAGALEDAYPCQ